MFGHHKEVVESCTTWPNEGRYLGDLLLEKQKLSARTSLAIQIRGVFQHLRHSHGLCQLRGVNTDMTSRQKGID